MEISIEELNKLLLQKYEEGYKRAMDDVDRHRSMQEINNAQGWTTEVSLKGFADSVPPACANCPKHPSNGGDGICHCTLGSMVVKY